jgi:hypothetical protein
VGVGLGVGGGEEQGQSEAELIAKMSPTERAAYETKRLKLRKAMVSPCTMILASKDRLWCSMYLP